MPAPEYENMCRSYNVHVSSRSEMMKYMVKKRRESAMHARFSSDGTKIVALRRRLFPVVFDTFTTKSLSEVNASILSQLSVSTSSSGSLIAIWAACNCLLNIEQ